MFKASVITVLAVCAGHFSQEETKLDLFYGEQKVGFCTYKENFDHKGRRTREFDIHSNDDASSKVDIFERKMVDAQGYPIEEVYERKETVGREHTLLRLTVKYNPINGAAEYCEQRGKVNYSKRSFPPTPGYSRADPSDLWFSKTRPLPGTRVSSTVFDIENAAWQKIDTTYVGKKWITVSGRQIEANEIRDIRDGKTRMVYLDDRGQPILMQNGPYGYRKHF